MTRAEKATLRNWISDNAITDPVKVRNDWRGTFVLDDEHRERFEVTDRGMIPSVAGKVVA